MNLLLSSNSQFVTGSELSDFESEAQKYVNWHLLQVKYQKHLLTGPLSFALLEGLLRRKNSNYVDINGKVIKSFKINFIDYGVDFGKKQLNGIDDSLRLFETYTVNDRGRPPEGLAELKKEIIALYLQAPNSDSYDLIDLWRNDLIHGRKYWSKRVSIVVNLICLLVVDEIVSNVYDSNLDVQHNLEQESLSSSRNMLSISTKFAPAAMIS